MSLVVDDDKASLKLMFEDSLCGSPLYRPSQFWEFYEKQHYKVLLDRSLRDLGDIGEPINGGFEAEESFPTFFTWTGSSLFHKNKDNPKFLELIAQLNTLIKTYPDEAMLPYELSISGLRRGACRYAESYGATRSAKPLADLKWPLVGNPTDIFEYRGTTLTYRALYYYTKYAFAAKHIDFDKIDVIVELGPGSGRQAALILDLHPHLTYLLFDIPTTLYFCYRFMSAVFPNRVVDYNRTRVMNSLDNIEPGMIYHFGSWQFPLLNGFNIPLFWNCQSLQEMEREAVLNYTSIVDSAAEAAMLVHSANGVQAGPPGSISLKAPGARADDYGFKYLSSFDVVERSTAYNVLGDDLGGDGGIEDIFLSRRPRKTPSR